MNFPLLIKQTRIALGETQAEFAERFATQANTVSRWESGQYQASYECLSFVVGYARDLVWSACPHCNGTGRVKSTLGKEAHKALNTKTSYVSDGSRRQIADLKAKLADANRGAQVNALVNESLAKKLKLAVEANRYALATFRALNSYTFEDSDHGLLIAEAVKKLEAFHDEGGEQR